MGAPSAGTFDPLQERGMGFNALSLQTQAHHRWSTLAGRRLATARALREQRDETAALLIELQLPVGGPLALGAVAMAIQPSAALAAQPTAQQPVGQQDLARHPLTLGGRLLVRHLDQRRR